MSALTKEATQPTAQNMCQGYINGKVPFFATLVELSEAEFPNYPVPHTRAHVMLATYMAPGPDYTTKELQITFTKDLPAGRYAISDAAYPVGVRFIDRSIPATPVVYTQSRGIAGLEYSAVDATLSGEISVDLENRDEDTVRILSVKVIFHAHPRVRVRRNPRRPSARTGVC